MLAQEFLKSQLSNLATQFTEVQIRYAYNKLIETHVVEITPEYEYYNNSSLDDAWINISLEFMEKFQDENISFISSDSSLAIVQADFEWNSFNLISLENLTGIFYSEINIFEQDFTGMTFPENLFYDPSQIANITVSLDEPKITITAHKQTTSSIIEVKITAGNTQYAMAA